MKIGVTGSRSTPTAVQRENLLLALLTAQEVHHGCCVGADALAHDICRERAIDVVVYPPDDHKHVYAMGLKADRLMPEKPYLLRNRDIVDSVDRLIAVPSAPERLRSGTWATVRFARNLGKQVTILWPDGSVTEENQ